MEQFSLIKQYLIDNPGWLGVLVLLFAIILLTISLLKPSKAAITDPIENSIDDTVETIPEVVVEEPVENQQENSAPVRTKGLTAIQEARKWWKTVEVSNKKIYMFDAELKDSKISNLTGAQILKIYNIYLETSENPSK